MRKKTNLLAFIICSVVMSSCCVLMPRARTSNVSVTVSPSNAEIYDSYGNQLGTGSATLHFDCKDSKDAYYNISMKADGYRVRTERIYNYRKDYSRNYTLEQKINTTVRVSVNPSNASIYYKNGNIAGTGSCTLTFDEDDSSDSYYELTLDAPNHYSRKVKVYKNGGNKSFSLERKPIKTVVVIPADADIAVNNDVVGKGKYDVSFENRDKVLLTFSCIGYETEIVTLHKNHTEQTITYQLDEDEAYINSIGGETAGQFVNRWVPIVVRKNLSEEEVWIRMLSIVREHFEDIEKTDKTSKWIKTFPAITPYKASDVRTVLEIVPSYSTGELQYKVRLSFEKRRKGTGDDGWQKYDRLLKRYQDVIPNLINSVGEGR